MVALGLWVGGLMLASCGGSSASSLEGVWTLDKMAVGDEVSELSGFFAAMMKSGEGKISTFELKSGGVVSMKDENGKEIESGLTWTKEGDRVIMKVDTSELDEEATKGEGAEQMKEILEEGVVFEVRDGQLWYNFTDAMAKMAEGMQAGLAAAEEGMGQAAEDLEQEMEAEGLSQEDIAQAREELKESLGEMGIEEEEDMEALGAALGGVAGGMASAFTSGETMYFIYVKK